MTTSVRDARGLLLTVIVGLGSFFSASTFTNAQAATNTPPSPSPLTNRAINVGQRLGNRAGRDPHGRIISVMDPAGHSVSYEYDAQGDLVGVTDRQTDTTRFVYSTAKPHYLEQMIDPLGRTGVRTEYDSQGRLSSLVDALGNQVQLLHDPDNSIETVVTRWAIQTRSSMTSVET
jgi:YD repeat-containing protein